MSIPGRIAWKQVLEVMDAKSGYSHFCNVALTREVQSGYVISLCVPRLCHG